MAAQQTIFSQTILGMKRALRHVNSSSDSDDVMIASSNRAKKPKRRAKYMSAGLLDTSDGPRMYRKYTEHAGYRRAIISRNPTLFDEDGDEVEDPYSLGGTLTPLEENPYEHVKIEHTLAPLTSASDLPSHPSLSHPYLSRAVTEMAQNAEAALRKERALLCHMIKLLVQLRGDEGWAPCGLFEPNSGVTRVLQRTSDGKKDADVLLPEDSKSYELDIDASLVHRNSDQQARCNDRSPTRSPASNDVEIRLPDTSGEAKFEDVDVDENGTDLSGVKLSPSLDVPAENEEVEQSHKHTNATAHQLKALGELDTDAIERPPTNNQAADIVGVESLTTNPNHVPESSLPSPPVESDTEHQLSHRMVTRAQAMASSKAPSPEQSNPQGLEYADETVHPFFKLSLGSVTDRDFVLSPLEADETRKLLVFWIQKQEEVVRETEDLCYGLLRADRMRLNVLRWTKAEGHIGEMSDGEDWYDPSEWGLEEDLVKGRDEEEDDANAQGKRARQRRAERS